MQATEAVGPSVTGSEIGTEKSRCSDWVCVKHDISLLSLWFSHYKKLSNTGGTTVPPAHAASWGSLTPSVTGSLCGAPKVAPRCSWSQRTDRR